MNRRKFLKRGIGLTGLTVLVTSIPLVSKLTDNRMKRILMITGSPRKNGNSEALAESFINGAIESGHQVTRFDSAFKEVKPCVGCNNCFSKENMACIFKDDFNELVTHIMQSDMIVFVTPLYWFTYTAKMKAAIDKFYSFLIGNKLETKNKETILLSVCGDENIAEFDTLVKQYKMMVSANQWTDIGQLLVPGVLAKGDISNKPEYLTKAEELGKTLDINSII